MPIHPPLPHDAERLVVNVVRSLSAAHLRRRPSRRSFFWGTLAEVFCVGSHSACGIARSCGYDPETGERLAPVAPGSGGMNERLRCLRRRGRPVRGGGRIRTCRAIRDLYLPKRTG